MKGAKGNAGACKKKPCKKTQKKGCPDQTKNCLDQATKEVKPEAPWGNSTFEAEAKEVKPTSEYSTTYYAKPANCKAKQIRPDSEGRRIIGNVNEQIEANTTYGNVFTSHAYNGKAAPYRPNENGIIYEIGPASSMTTTHDRTFTTSRFPAKRNIPRNEPNETDKVPKSTMKRDFDYKQATEKVMPYLPPVGLSDTFGNDKVELTSTTKDVHVANDLRTIEAVKNFKPIRTYKKPSEVMVCETTTHSAFTGIPSRPAESCKPKYRSNGIH